MPSRNTALVAGACFVLACNAIAGIDAATLRPEDAGAMDAGDAGPTEASSGDAPSGDASREGAAVDAAPACNPDAEFGQPSSLGPVIDTARDEIGGFVSPDGTEFYFARRGGDAGTGGYQMYRAAMDTNGDFSAVTFLDGVNESDAADPTDFNPAVSPNGLRLYFFSYRAGTPPGYGGPFKSERPTSASPWGAPSIVSVLAGVPLAGEYPIVGALYSASASSLFRSDVDDAGYIFAPADIDPGAEAGINIGGKNGQPVITPDELHLYFSSDRTALYHFHIYESHRATKSAPWSTPVALKAGINASDIGDTDDQPAYITPDNCTLYYSSQLGNHDIFRVTRGM